MSELTAILQKRLASNEAQFVHDNGQWFSTTQFRNDVLKVQRLLHESQIKIGSRIMLADGNSYGFLVVYVALLTAGMCIIPINPQMPLPEMRKVFARSEAKGAFINPALEDVFSASPEKSDALGEQPLKAACDLLVAIHYGDERFDVELRSQGSASTNRTSESGLSTRPGILPQISEETAAILLFTSGTTGTPKGVALTHRQVMATVHHIAESHRLTPADVSYCFLPLFHINAQVIGFLTTMYTGGKMVVEEKFSASRFWDTVRDFEVTWVSAVPTVIAILVKKAESMRAPSTLRFVRSASAPLPAFQAHRFESLFGVPVIESYGMTEAASQICVNPIPPGKRKIGSVGLPYGIDLQIMDAEGNALPSGEIGEIVIRGDSVIERYAIGDESGSSFHQGWFKTGDMGYVDAEGYVFITGRSKEMINRAGQKISPREVEEIICSHPQVNSAAVIGLPDPVYGEKVAAYLITDDGSKIGVSAASKLKQELVELCQQNLSSYKCPVEYFFVDSIPVGPTGKIQRHRLKQEVMAAGRA